MFSDRFHVLIMTLQARGPITWENTPWNDLVLLLGMPLTPTLRPLRRSSVERAFASPRASRPLSSPQEPSIRVSRLPRLADPRDPRNQGLLSFSEATGACWQFSYAALLLMGVNDIEGNGASLRSQIEFEDIALGSRDANHDVLVRRFLARRQHVVTMIYFA